jgi:glutaredoxin
MCVPLSAAGNKRNRIEFAEEKLHAMEEEEEEEEVMQKLKKRIKKGSTTVVPVIASDESGS